MPKLVTISETQIKRLKVKEKPYRVACGLKLYLLIHSNGTMYWHIRAKKDDGKMTDFHIGKYPGISLAEACRIRDFDVLKTTSKKKASNVPKTPTFKECALRCIDVKKHEAIFRIDGSCSRLIIHKDTMNSSELYSIPQFEDERNNIAIREVLDRCVEEKIINTSNPFIIHQLKSGVGSFGVFFIEAATPLVIKIGFSSILLEEVNFFQSAFKYTQYNKNVTFPKVLLKYLDKIVGWFVMEAGQSITLEDIIYESQEAFKHRKFSKPIYQLCQDMSEIYSSNIKDSYWNLDNYHLIGRTENLLLNNIDLKYNSKKLFSPGFLNSTIEKEMIINGESYASARQLISQCKSIVVHMSSALTTFIHGDFQVRNIVPRRSNSGYFLIDPRTNWEGNSSTSKFEGSPLYDMANLFHSVAGLSSILRSKELGVSLLISKSDVMKATSLEFTQSFLDSARYLMEHFEECIERTLPSIFLTTDWRKRLYLYAANSTFGWLRSESVTSNQEIWLAIYSSGIRLLNAAIK